jgi:hypothetical protein
MPSGQKLKQFPFNKNVWFAELWMHDVQVTISVQE